MSNLSAPHFHNEVAAYAYVEARLWPNGPVCPHCGGVDRISKMQGKSTRVGAYKCYQCRKPFTVKIGTIFEDSKVGMRLWLQAMYLIAGSKKGISSNQLHRILGVTLKTAWFMSHRIREAMRSGDLSPMGGEGSIVEVDETFIGHKSGAIMTRGGHHKLVVLSLVDRATGKARSMVINEKLTSAVLLPIVMANVAKETRVMTDEGAWRSNGGSPGGPAGCLPTPRSAGFPRARWNGARRVLVELARRGTRLGCDDVTQFVTDSLVLGARHEAEQVWLAHCPGAHLAGSIADPAFAEFATEEASPFGWQAPPSGDVEIEPAADAAGKHGVKLANRASVSRLMLTQPLAVPPGRYRLTAAVAAGRLAGSIGCAGQPPLPHDVVGDPGSGGQVLEVAGACQRPVLGLWLRPGGGETALGPVALVPAAQASEARPPASARRWIPAHSADSVASEKGPPASPRAALAIAIHSPPPSASARSSAVAIAGGS